MLTVWVGLLTQIISLANNRLALAKMRAELETDPALKKAAIDEGLKVSDGLNTFVQNIRERIAALKEGHNDQV